MKYQKTNHKGKRAGCLAAVLAAVLLALGACGQPQSGGSSAAASTEATASGGQQAAGTGEQQAAGTGEQQKAGTGEKQAAPATGTGEQQGAQAAGAGKQQGAGGAQTGSSVTVIDMTGREITLDEPATRVVALTPSDCEILYAIGAGKTLVGRGEYCDYPAEVLDVPAVNSGSDTNVEQILELEPQVLLMSTMAQTEEQVRQLEDAGVHVVVSDAQDIEGTYTAIEMIGALMGRDAEAASVVEGMRDDFAEIESKSGGDGSEDIYFEVSPLEYGLWAAGSNTFMNEVADMLGLQNCFADVDGWGSVSEEQVLERDPDYIVTITMYYGEGPTPEEEILSRPGWENITAVKNGAILNLPDNELSRPGPRLADGARELYDFVYGNGD